MAVRSFDADDLREMYFDYIYSLSGLDKHDNNPKLSKRAFAKKLHQIPFKKYDEGDDSRAADGTGLRYQFAMSMRDAYFSELDYDEFKTNFSEACDFPCTTLEMMVGLSDKMEAIMADPDYPDRHVQWISKMISSLGITGYRQEIIDVTPDWEKNIEEAIDRLYKRTYEANGDGGLFYIIGISGEDIPDMRQLSIWDQAMAYLNKLT